MSFSQRAPWNHFGISSDQFQQPTVPTLRGRQHNEFNLLQSNNSSGHQWENDFSQNAQFASYYDSMNILCPPPPNFARFPPPGPPPPPQNSFSTYPPTIPPPNSTFSFNSTAGKQHGVTLHPPSLHTFPPNLNLKNLPLQIVSNQYNQASFMPSIPLRTPSSFSQFVPSAIQVSPSPNKTGTESEIEKSQKYKAVGYQKLERWLQCNKKTKKSEPKTSHQKGKESVKIWDFLNKMKGMHDLISSLSTHVATLSANMCISDNSAWEASKSQCNVIKEQLSSGFDYLLTDNHLQEVNKKLICIRHKRARMKKARMAKFEEKQLQQRLWEEKTLKINKWQETLRMKIQMQDKEKRSKAAADRTLSKITREIHDATRLVDTMLALEKLRLIRRDAAQKRGGSAIGESRQSFEDKIKDMTRLVRAQLESYKEEEAKLKQVLKTEEEEKSKLECQDREDQARLEQEEEDRKLRLILFGPDEIVCQSDPLLLCNQYYKQASYSLSSLLQIRQEWDAFLVPKSTPASSCIPSSWVMPEPPSSSSWGTAL